MIGFIGILIVLLGGTIVYQLISTMRIVEANTLAVIAGKGSRGLQTLRGGRVFVLPIIQKFFDMDLRPHTTTIAVESAIASGIVPLNVRATVSFAIATSSETGVLNAIRRIMQFQENPNKWLGMAHAIIEGHVRDAVAPMTPEEVMANKDQLVTNMINICKHDLEGIGLEITSMNIADVDDHRLEGVEDPELYIALLRRIQETTAQCESQKAHALASAAAKEAEERNRAQVTVRQTENERQQLEAETRVQVQRHRQRQAVGVEQAERSARAEIAGITAQIEAEKRRIEMLKAQFEADIIVPAQAESQRLRLDAERQSAEILGVAQAELDQLEQTVDILTKGGEAAIQVYLVDNFKQFTEPMIRSLTLFEVKEATVISGAPASATPLSAIHPHPIEEEKARLLQEAFQPSVSERLTD
ncbi:hypothetical protein NKDENANG_01774 [Candidatus Entotheonellaceae bacterium PAL068K]